LPLVGVQVFPLAKLAQVLGEQAFEFEDGGVAHAVDADLADQLGANEGHFGGGADGLELLVEQPLVVLDGAAADLVALFAEPLTRLVDGGSGLAEQSEVGVAVFGAEDVVHLEVAAGVVAGSARDAVREVIGGVGAGGVGH
jgi:hypothetical protein